jgi:TonB family protein
MRSTRAVLATAAALAAMAVAAQSPPPQPGAAASGIRSGAACRPAYPVEALKAKVQGDTQLRLSIDTGGRIASAEVVKSAGLTPEHKLLDQAIARSVQGCTLFAPRTDPNGQPVAYSVDIFYPWRLPRADGSPAPTPRPPRLDANDPGCRPTYPPAALRAAVKGVTRLRMTIEYTGRVKSVQVVQSAGERPEHKLLDQAAADALSKCKYTPGTDYDGKPVGGQVDIQYQWKLE